MKLVPQRTVAGRQVMTACISWRLTFIGEGELLKELRNLLAVSALLPPLLFAHYYLLLNRRRRTRWERASRLDRVGMVESPVGHRPLT